MRIAEQPAECLQLGELVLRERFGGEQIERAARWILKDGAQDGRVVAERLAGRGRRDHDDIAAGERVVDRLGLMSVKLSDAARFECVLKPLVDRPGERCVLCGNRRQTPEGRDEEIRRIGPVRKLPRRQALERGLQRAIAAGAGTGCQIGPRRQPDVRHGRAIVPAVSQAIKR